MFRATVTGLDDLVAACMQAGRHPAAANRIFNLGDGDESSNMIDDDMVEILEDRDDDATREELTGFINELNEDEQVELVALAWVGRGSFSKSEWNDAVGEARRAHNDRTAEYLLGLPLLADYLAEGLAEFGHTCDE